MNTDQIEAALQHLATRESLADLRADIHKDFGDFRADLIKTLWITQLSTVGIILIGVGLLIHFHP